MDGRGAGLNNFVADCGCGLGFIWPLIKEAIPQHSISLRTSLRDTIMGETKLCTTPERDEEHLNLVPRVFSPSFSRAWEGISRQDPGNKLTSIPVIFKCEFPPPPASLACTQTLLCGERAKKKILFSYILFIFFFPHPYPLALAVISFAAVLFSSRALGWLLRENRGFVNRLPFPGWDCSLWDFQP